MWSRCSAEIWSAGRPRRSSADRWKFGSHSRTAEVFCGIHTLVCVTFWQGYPQLLQGSPPRTTVRLAIAKAGFVRHRAHRILVMKYYDLCGKVPPVRPILSNFHLTDAIELNNHRTRATKTQVWGTIGEPVIFKYVKDEIPGISRKLSRGGANYFKAFQGLEL